MKYVFFGTPRFAAIILEKLINAGMPSVALVCNPDRPVGRKQVITPPATKVCILNHEARIKDEIKIFQPGELNMLRDTLFALQPDFFVVAAYAKILPKEILEIPRLGAIGIHPSLLPKYRGATPIQSAILAGERETGTTLYLLNEKMDEGPILAQRKISLDQSFDSRELENKLAELGAELLIEMLPRFVKGEIDPVPQDESQVTYTQKFTTEDGYIKPEELKEAIDGNSERAESIDRKVRALNPEPGVYAFLDGKRTKILLTKIKDGKLILKRIQHAGSKPTDV